jgi:acyl-CoA dehydrogenase
MSIDADSFEILLITVRRFVRERLVPAENAVEENDEVPADIVEEMKDLGLFGLSIPEEFGGIGLSMSQECRVAHEIARHRSPSAPCSARMSESVHRAY